MASNKQRQRLKGLIDGEPGDPQASAAPDEAAEPSAAAAAAADSEPAPGIQRGLGYHLGSQLGPDDDLNQAVGKLLSDSLQNLARLYVGARRRSGEELLKAARWLSEARAMAQVGEWQMFLDATNTSHDTATRLINIHRRAMENPQFAESVARNWIGHSAAALLAKPSTPPEVIEEVLAGDEPPSVAEVREAIRAGKEAATTQCADSEQPTGEQEPTAHAAYTAGAGSGQADVDVIQRSFFDKQERAIIPVLTGKLDLVLRGNASLQPEEWHLIEPLAEALQALLRIREQPAGE